MIKPNVGLDLLIGDPLHSLKLKDASDQIYRAEVLEALIRDVSDLLNSRPTYELEELKGFILTYGLLDLVYFSPYSLDDQKAVGSLIKECISLFEPRLKDLEVTPIGDTNNYGTTFYFRIAAAIEFQDGSMPVILETQIDGATRDVHLNLSKEEYE